MFKLIIFSISISLNTFAGFRVKDKSGKMLSPEHLFPQLVQDSESRQSLYKAYNASIYRKMGVVSPYKNILNFHTEENIFNETESFLGSAYLACYSFKKYAERKNLTFSKDIICHIFKYIKLESGHDEYIHLLYNAAKWNAFSSYIVQHPEIIKEPVRISLYITLFDTNTQQIINTLSKCTFTGSEKGSNELTLEYKSDIEFGIDIPFRELSLNKLHVKRVDDPQYSYMSLVFAYKATINNRKKVTDVILKARNMNNSELPFENLTQDTVLKGAKNGKIFDLDINSMKCFFNSLCCEDMLYTFCASKLDLIVDTSKRDFIINSYYNKVFIEKGEQSKHATLCKKNKNGKVTEIGANCTENGMIFMNDYEVEFP